MKDSLKPILEDIVVELESQQIDLNETPALFNWRYEDNPDVNYQLLIKRGWDREENRDGTVH